MHMVHADDARDIGDKVRLDVARVQLVRCPFEQDVSGGFHDLPAAPEHDDGDEDREQRIDGRPAGEEYYGSRGESRHGAEQITEHVDGCALDIEVLAVRAMQQSEGE